MTISEEKQRAPQGAVLQGKLQALSSSHSSPALFHKAGPLLMLQDAAGRGLKIQSPCPFGEREGDEEYLFPTELVLKGSLRKLTLILGKVFHCKIGY